MKKKHLILTLITALMMVLLLAGCGGGAEWRKGGYRKDGSHGWPALYGQGCLSHYLAD